MPRPNGRFTYDADLGRFRNAGGQLIPDNAVIGTEGARVSADDALEMIHGDHVAGAAGPGWINHMQHDGLTQPCITCGQMVGLGDVTLSGTHSRDWSKGR